MNNKELLKELLERKAVAFASYNRAIKEGLIMEPEHLYGKLETYKEIIELLEVK